MFFVRDNVQAGAKKSLSIWFQDNVVLRLLQQGRESLGWIPGTPVPAHLFGQYWQDAQMDEMIVLLGERGDKLADHHECDCNQ